MLQKVDNTAATICSVGERSRSDESISSHIQPRDALASDKILACNDDFMTEVTATTELRNGVLIKFTKIKTS